VCYLWASVSKYFKGVEIMKKLLIGVLGLVALSSAAPAVAADLAYKAPPMAAPVAVYNWTGFYIGANVGGGWDHINYSNSSSGTFAGAPSTPSSFSGSRNLSGALGGGQIGFNYQFSPNWVLGIEADGDAADLSGSNNGCGLSAAGAVVSCATGSTKVRDFGTVRGRLGYALNNVLFYGTGGWAWDHDRTSTSITCIGATCPAGAGFPFTSNSPSASSSNSGWAAGAGIEWGFFPHWTFRAEYMHLQFDNIQSTYNYVGTIRGLPFATTSRSQASASTDLVRIGVNYLFN
jgi:outer membrane immunogenic protein